MNKTIRKATSGLSLSFIVMIAFFLTLPKVVSAHCPLCVGGAAVGLSVARFLGVDDAISGIWFAAFLGALALYISGRFKNIFIKASIYLITFAFTIWSFYYFNTWSVDNLKFFLINTHLAKILGLDRLTFGIVFGGIYFLIVDFFDNLIIKKHGKVYFPYQRVFVSLGSILLVSIVMFLIINF